MLLYEITDFEWPEIQPLLTNKPLLCQGRWPARVVRDILKIAIRFAVS